MSGLPDRPITVLIAAMGGEGGGGVDALGSEGGRLLLRWIEAAAVAAGMPVQSTLLPGTTQRTGTTTYYLELYPVPWERLGGRRPVFRLAPRPGDVDLMVAYELLEGARAIQRGFVTPDRTTLIASLHRTYTILEKMPASDGRFDGDLALAAAREKARECVLFDMEAARGATGSGQHAVILGAIAAAEVLPLGKEALADAMGRSGVSNLDANLAGFAAGYDAAWAAKGRPPETLPEPTPDGGHIEPRADRLLTRVDTEFPQATRAILRHGVSRLVDYQGRAYAGTYLGRLAKIRDLDRAEHGHALTIETGRFLATWMSFEDVIRVADLKSRPSRLARVRREAGAGAGDIVTITEFLKPGLDELCSILPGVLARPILALAQRMGVRDRFNVGLKINTTSVSGTLLLRAMALMRVMRRLGYRFARERAAIDRWLGAIQSAAPLSYDFALEVAACARLVRGYGDTNRRGMASFDRLMAQVTEPGLRGEYSPATAAQRLREGIEAALADPEGDSLDRAISTIEPETTPGAEAGAAG